MRHRYVIYRIDFANGQFYIGKAKDFNNRKSGHINGCFKGTTLKDKVLLKTPYRFAIIDSAPENLSEFAKGNWMDVMEKIYIHEYAKRVYNDITGLNTNYSNYSDYRKVVNVKMVNTQLY